MKIAHLTSAHSRYDTRIFLKECVSLAAHGHQVWLTVADGNGNEVKSGVTIVDAGSSRGRMDRIRRAPTRVLERALQINADVYHLHDPELLPIGIKLKKRGKKIVFDAHEDVTKQLLTKPYLSPIFRWMLSKVFGIYEGKVCRRLDAVVAATPCILEKFRAMGVNSICINNYPLPHELTAGPLDWPRKKYQVCYVGGVSRIRGIIELTQAMASVATSVRLQLVGTFSEMDVEADAKASTGWERVDALGHLSRDQVAAVLADSMAGLVTFLPVPNHIEAQPNKMFEYMSAGLPVIASDFPLWREIIEGNACGMCVDPLDPTAIARAIDYLVLHPQEAESMGHAGQRAVQEKYNWLSEEAKLLQLYESLI